MLLEVALGYVPQGGGIVDGRGGEAAADYAPEGCGVAFQVIAAQQGTQADALAALAVKVVRDGGGALLVVPDQRDVDQFEEALRRLQDGADGRRRSYQTLGLCAGAALAILFL